MVSSATVRVCWTLLSGLEQYLKIALHLALVNLFCFDPGARFQKEVPAWRGGKPGWPTPTSLASLLAGQPTLFASLLAGQSTLLVVERQREAPGVFAFAVILAVLAVLASFGAGLLAGRLRAKR